MSKCFNCEFLLKKNLEKGHSVMLPKDCPDCRKLAPRASMRPVRSPQKPKGGR